MIIVFLIALFLFLYIYLIYPLFIYLLWKFFKVKHLEDDNYEPTVSLIVPCLNEEMTIEDKIKNSLEIDYPKDKLEIIIIDSSSTDKTNEIAKSYENLWIKTILVPHNWKAFAMKYAVDNACNWEIIISSDANAFFEKDTVRKIVKHFSDKKIWWVTWAMRQIDQSWTLESEWWDLYWRIEKIMRIFESQFHSVISMSWEISCFRKEIAKWKQWYQKWCPDDFNLSLFIVESWHRVIYEKDAFVYEKAPDVAQDVEKQKTRIIVQTITSIILNIRMIFYPRYWIIFLSHKVLPLLSPIFLIILFISNLFLLNNKIFLFIFSIQLLFYILYFLKINISNLKITNFFIFLNYLILKSWYLYFKWRDFTKRDKINSSRINIKK